MDEAFFHRVSSSRLQFDSLDGLRGVAVLFVVLSHMSHLGVDVGLRWTGSGKYGVFLFFVLSAFLLTYAMLHGGSEGFRRRDRWIVYGVRRVLRIVPLYLVVLLSSYVSTQSYASPHFVPVSARELLEHLTLQDGKHLFWTIPVEFKYYVVLPLVAASFLLVLRGRTLWVVPAVAIALALITLILWPPARSHLNTIALGPYLPIFVLGSSVAFLQWKVDARGGVRSPSLRLVFELAGVGASLIVLSMVPDVWSRLSGSPVLFTHFHRCFLVFGLLWSVVLLGILNGIGWLRHALSTRPMRWVGVVSFSIYLWHWPIVSYVTSRAIGHAALEALAVLVTVFIASTLSYLCIERPFIRLPRVAGRLRTEPGAYR